MKVLFVVDVQNDFCPGGALAVPGGDGVVEEINKLIISNQYDHIFFSQDWHPSNHISFASNHGVDPFTLVGKNIVWPNHCVQGTVGAELHKDLVIRACQGSKALWIKKGQNPNEEEYSAYNWRTFPAMFDPNLEIDVVGLATDYCVKATALALDKSGFKVNVLLKACRGVAPETTEAAIVEMKAAGINVS